MHKYDLVVNFIKNQIQTGQFEYGDRIPSENELVRRFSLSRCTVRRAIELLTNQGWLEKRHGSGTFVRNTGPLKPRSNIIGVITTYLDDYIFPTIIRPIEDICAQHGYSLHLGITGNKVEKERVCLQSMLEHHVDGLIMEATKSALPNPNLDLFQTFADRQIPIVFINSRYDAFDCSYVMMDDERSGFLAGEYLIGCGHQNIAAVFKSDDMQGHKRYSGFLRSMHTHGLSVEENSVLWYTTEDIPGLFNEESDKMLMRRLAKSSAVICYNDQIALKILQMFEREHLRAPEDVSIIGFDNSDLCEISSVKLTSIAHAPHEMGILAANGLLELISSGKRIRKLIPPKLVIRDSVKITAHR